MTESVRVPSSTSDECLDCCFFRSWLNSVCYFIQEVLYGEVSFHFALCVSACNLHNCNNKFSAPVFAFKRIQLPPENGGNVCCRCFVFSPVLQPANSASFTGITQSCRTTLNQDHLFAYCTIICTYIASSFHPSVWIPPS